MNERPFKIFCVFTGRGGVSQLSYISHDAVDALRQAEKTLTSLDWATLMVAGVNVLGRLPRNNSNGTLALHVCTYYTYDAQSRSRRQCVESVHFDRAGANHDAELLSYYQRDVGCSEWTINRPADPSTTPELTSSVAMGE